MENQVSPKYLMKLIKDVDAAIWEEFKSYKEVRLYISKWHQSDEDINGYWENFAIRTKGKGDIDLLETLHTMTGSDVLKIAIDLGVDTPDFIPSIPTFKNELKSDFKVAYGTFQKAYKQIESDPSVAIGLANSSLESIIKEILKDDRINVAKGNETLYKLAQMILKELQLIGSDFPIEIKTIGSSLLAICQSIEKLRSEKTDFHGKTDDDDTVDEAIYTTLVVNSVATVGLFLNAHYKKHFPKPVNEMNDDEEYDLPF